MCVILSAESKRLSKKLMTAAAAMNPDGNGLAWISGKVVEYEKGLSLSDAIRLARELPMPYVFHARIATAGGIRPELCHPFSLDRTIHANAPAGRTPKGVLFHNGHWADWRAWLPPSNDGHWSDTRAIAELVQTYTLAALDEAVPTTQKIAVLTPRGIKYFGSGWVQVAPGIRGSNDYFLPGPQIRQASFSLSGPTRSSSRAREATCAR